ncbi:hypothetical protein MTR67_013691 [Solanum verrucosum]|uniref:Copia protein n=1 Tax=Solanum verrucosum TaxID=315347 RepID=A0AAF0QGQ3_SOLVR|nr:hypothetical protein MTR67_013691 [Solanum verrucosum]
MEELSFERTHSAKLTILTSSILQTPIGLDPRLIEDSEYKAMAQSTCEIMWIHHLLSEVGLKYPTPAKLCCDNQTGLHIASNQVYHERTKHIEVDCHFIREKIQENLISTGYVKTGEQLADLFTKALN